MTEEEIAALVEEARALVRVSDGETGIMLDRLVTALPRLLEAERERCAKIAEEYDWRNEPDTPGWEFHNPDTGDEWSANHPIGSGECADAESIRPVSWRVWCGETQSDRIAAAIRARKDGGRP